MARLVGPDEGSREVKTINGGGFFKSKASRTATVYTDSGATSLADILTYPGGVAISGSVVTIDSYSMLPLIQFPDGVDTLYVVVDGGPAWAIYARTDDRLDTLAARLADVEAGGTGDALLVHKAGIETIAGAKVFSVAVTVATPTSASHATTKTYVDTADTAVQAAAVQRSAHTGVQPISTVTGLQTALDAKTPRLALVVNAAGTADYASIAAALTAIGSTQADLAVTSAVTLAGNTTIPANVRLRVQRLGSIALAGFTFTINGRLEADRSQIFTGSGTVTLAATSVEAALPEWWGAVPAAIGSTPSVDSGPAITSAVYAVKAVGGVVDCTAGNYKISTAVDASNVQASQSFHVTPKTVTIRGRGSRETYWTGGETSYGFLEMVGSNYIKVEGITMQATGTLQYGILTGRPSGNGSSGLHRFTDVHIYGSYTVAAFFGMASEVCNYDGVSIYTLAGKPMVLAKDIGTWPVTAKYTALSPTTPYGGGNGVNRMTACQLQTSSADAADCALFLEFTQTFHAENLYIFTHNAAAQIIMQRRSHDATFVNLHQEYLNTEPWGIYYSATEDSGISPQFTNQTFIGCRMYGIYTEDLVSLSNVHFRGCFRGIGGKTYIVDVYTGIDMNIHSADTSICPDIAGISQANLKYRIRSSGGYNEFGSCPAANLSVPDSTVQMIGTRSDTETFTNKRITQRTAQSANPSSVNLNWDTTDEQIITALGQSLTIGITGTPTSAQEMTFRLKDNGVSRSLSWDSHYRGFAAALPSASTAGKTTYMVFRYNSADAKADMILMVTEP